MLEGSVSIVGQAQGQFHGDRDAAPAEGEASNITEFSYDVQQTFDPATGAPSGHRVHGPVRFRKAWNSGSPQIMTAIATNENLTTVKFQFLRRGQAAGADVEMFYTITLSNARVVEYSQNMDSTDDPTKDTKTELVGLIFQNIEVAHVIAGVNATDTFV